MKNSLKGAFWSGLIFPGLGQIVLKHYKRGAVIMITVLVCMSVFIVKAVLHALDILEKFESQGGAISMSTITNAVTQASATSGNLTFNIVLLLVILCWIIGVVDAYRIGKIKDIEEGSARQASNGNDN
jgi:ABC-type dipeptide/oligopeptide/nickel transport system permease component